MSSSPRNEMSLTEEG